MEGGIRPVIQHNVYFEVRRARATAESNLNMPIIVTATEATNVSVRIKLMNDKIQFRQAKLLC